MIEHHSQFLSQLRESIKTVAADTGEAGQRLLQLSERLDLTEDGRSAPVTIDSEQGRIVINTSHPAVEKLMSRATRRKTDLVFFISSMMSLLNREEEHIEDHHEKEFHARLLSYALEECQGTWMAQV